MYKYRAVTNTTVENCTALLRVDVDGLIWQYDLNKKAWRSADGEMYGIYSGDVEYEAISEKGAEKIIAIWQSVM